jgi:hypothetical protein
MPGAAAIHGSIRICGLCRSHVTPAKPRAEVHFPLAPIRRHGFFASCVTAIVSCRTKLDRI